MMRFEFVEAVCRVVAKVFKLDEKGQNGAAAPTPGPLAFATAFQRFYAHLRNLPAAALCDCDVWRKTRLYARQTDAALQPYALVLRQLHAALGTTTRPLNGKGGGGGGIAPNTLDPTRWATFVDESGLLCAEVATADAHRAFVSARMRFVDDFSFKTKTLTFVSFLEAVCRVCDASPLPSRAQLARQTAPETLAEFYEDQSWTCAQHPTSPDATDQCELALDSLANARDEEPYALHEKLALLLPYIMHNLAIAHQGTFKTKTATVRLPTLTARQRDRWLAQHVRPRTRRKDLQAVYEASALSPAPRTI